MYLTEILCQGGDKSSSSRFPSISTSLRAKHLNNDGYIFHTQEEKLQRWEDVDVHMLISPI